MQTVGLRELKNRLAEFVRQVRAGEGLLVTDRGMIVAELLPPRAYSVDDATTGLAALSKSGVVTLGAPNDPAAYPALPRLLRRLHAHDLLEQERGSDA